MVCRILFFFPFFFPSFPPTLFLTTKANRKQRNPLTDASLQCFFLNNTLLICIVNILILPFQHFRFYTLYILNKLTRKAIYVGGQHFGSNKITVKTALQSRAVSLYRLEASRTYRNKSTPLYCWEFPGFHKRLRFSKT